MSHSKRVMNWSIPIIAGLFELGWAIGLKYTEGFTRLWPTVGTELSMFSYVLENQSDR